MNYELRIVNFLNLFLKSMRLDIIELRKKIYELVIPIFLIRNSQFEILTIYQANPDVCSWCAHTPCLHAIGQFWQHDR